MLSQLVKLVALLLGTARALILDGWHLERVWNDLHGYNQPYIQPNQDMHTVLRMSPKSKKKKEVNSPRVISSFDSMFNGVDRKEDRDTSDWTISVKSHRWYLRPLYYWLVDAAIHSSYLLVVHIANKRAETNPERAPPPPPPMVDKQWKEWQDDLPDGLGSLADGEGTPVGLP
jgi:hypothetical protein